MASLFDVERNLGDLLEVICARTVDIVLGSEVIDGLELRERNS
jgi:hypothetical protein